MSVITATRNRHQDLMEAVQQVRAQVYRPLEHVIVSDGPDEALKDLVCEWKLDGRLMPSDRKVPIVYAETGRVWSDEMRASPGAAAWQVAQLLGHGTLQMWLSDDETMTPDHIQLLVDAIEGERVDFAYSQARWYTAPGIHPPQDRVIGQIPPTEASITNCLYRTALLDYAKFETHRGRGTDWHQISSWIRAGASYAFVRKVTFTHRADQVGGQFPDIPAQPLRGRGHA